MAQYLCKRTCQYQRRLWEKGEIIEADKRPNEHFELIGGEEEKKKLSYQELVVLAKENGIDTESLPDKKARTVIAALKEKGIEV